MKTMKVRLTFTEELLGTLPSDPEIYDKFVMEKEEMTEEKIKEELESLSYKIDSLSDDDIDEKLAKEITVFSRDENGDPHLWDYQIRGFFKEACSMMNRVSSSKSKKLKAYKKVIDGVIFVDERKIPLHFDGEIGDCQRPLRALTAKGERVCLANSETIPAGAWIEFTIRCLEDSHMPYVIEWLDYGFYHGLGQWRNSGKGRFVWEEVA